MRIAFAFWIACLGVFVSSGQAFETALEEGPIDEVVLTECLMIPSVGESGRWPLFTDALEADWVKGTWTPPQEGETVLLPDGAEVAWQAVTANENGAIEPGEYRRGYAYFAIRSATDRIVQLQVRGHNFLRANNELRSGNPYGYGFWRVPVRLKPGLNSLLVRHSRGNLRVVLQDAPAALSLNTGDMTLPDLRVGRRASGEAVQYGSVPLLNNTRQSISDVFIQSVVTLEDDAREFVHVAPAEALLPLSVAKVPFRFEAPDIDQKQRAVLQLNAWRGSPEEENAQIIDSATVELRILDPHEPYKQTFISEIDNSVQYYAVNPARPLENGGGEGALFLSLHGASVEAINQAQAYSSKNWGTLVAPTNRRPYGFDWEDWGRMDALEVLGIAQERFAHDPARVYLTGHSMGGHGTWQVGAHYPDQFAAIAPSAGWISFMSYSSAPRDVPDDDIANILVRSRAASDTLALKNNYKHHGVYILHGGGDNNVPASEARRMVEELEPIHHDFVYHEEPGQGHWWDLSDEPGADCVDWAPMFDFFARHARPQAEMVRAVDFTTVNPEISSQSRWVKVVAQQTMMATSRVQLQFDPGMRRFSGETENVLRMALDTRVVRPGEPITLMIDAEQPTLVTAWEPGQWLYLEKTGQGWQKIEPPAAAQKGPQRYGPFKQAFQNRMVFVFGTRGTPEENNWAMSKARFDAETWWYRGNGYVHVMSDEQFEQRGRMLYPQSNVILYGNAETNLSWNGLLGDSPVWVTRGQVQVGDRVMRGEDLACLFIQPRPDTHQGLVAALTATGPTGFRLTNRAPYFISGVAYPDCIVLSPEVLSDRSQGVRCAGFFGLDWKVASGDFAWQQE